jgi:UDP-glucose 4-epimerase
VGGTLNVLDAAKDAGVKRLVFASSSSIYGDNENLPKTEDMPPRPMSPYAVAKLAGEKYCQVFFSIYGLETVALRYFNRSCAKSPVRVPFFTLHSIFVGLSAQLRRVLLPAAFGIHNRSSLEYSTACG